jgi:hypothetical protein
MRLPKYALEGMDGGILEDDTIEDIWHVPGVYFWVVANLDDNVQLEMGIAPRYPNKGPWEHRTMCGWKRV